MPRVDLVYDTGCPNVEAARAELREALGAAGLAPMWEERCIGDPDCPSEMRGYGSPSILVDGEDVAGAVPSTGARCRVYPRADGSIAPVPGAKEILRAITNAGLHRHDGRRKS